MPRCSCCGRRFVGEQEICAICSDPLRSRQELPQDDICNGVWDSDVEESTWGPMIPIARFNNAAEAGFFAYELQAAEDVPVRMAAEDDFNALGGQWSTRYMLLAPEDHAQTAALALKELVEQSEGDELMEPHSTLARRAAFIGDPVSGPMADAAGRNVLHWLPIVLTLAAGSAALIGMRKLHDRPKANLPVPPVGRHVELWRTLAAPRTPWRLHHDGVDGTWQLWIDRDLAIIREDADGDGVFEKELELRPAGIGR